MDLHNFIHETNIEQKNMAKSRSWQGKRKEMRRNSAEQASDFKDFGGV